MVLFGVPAALVRQHLGGFFIQKGAADFPATPSVTGQQSFVHFYTARQGLCDKKDAADKMVTTQATYTF